MTYQASAISYIKFVRSSCPGLGGIRRRKGWYILFVGLRVNACMHVSNRGFLKPQGPSASLYDLLYSSVAISMAPCLAGSTALAPLVRGIIIRRERWDERAFAGENALTAGRGYTKNNLDSNSSTIKLML